MFSVGTANTMRLQGKIKNQKVIILVDTGSTNDFIDATMVRKLNYTIQPLLGVSVTVSNGEQIAAQGICKDVQWETNSWKQLTDFLVLPLMGCDLVLGVDWLQKLGPIT